MNLPELIVKLTEMDADGGKIYAMSGGGDYLRLMGVYVDDEGDIIFSEWQED